MTAIDTRVAGLPVPLSETIEAPLVVDPLRSDRSLRPEQEQPLAGNEPDVWIARDRDAARDADRIIAAEARHVDVGVRCEGVAIANIAEAPDHAAIAQLEIGFAGRRRILNLDRPPN